MDLLIYYDLVSCLGVFFVFVCGFGDCFWFLMDLTMVYSGFEVGISDF